MRSIKSNLLAFAVLATLLPSVGLGLLSFVGYQDIVQRNVDHELRSLAKDASGEITTWVRDEAHDIRTLATAYTLVDGLRGGAPRPGALPIGAQELAAYLESVQQKLEPLLELTVTDAAGTVVASSARAPEPVALPASWQHAALTSGMVVAPPRWDAARGTGTLTIAVPVLSLRNELVGALSAVVDLAAVTPRLRDALGSSSAEIVLLAGDGTPLLSTRTAASSLARLDAQDLVRLRSESTASVTYVDFRGREAVGVAAAPTALSLVVVAQRERAAVYAAWLELVERYVLLVAGLTVVVGVVAYWMGRSIAGPLSTLTAAADRVARGDLSVTVKDETNDEIGQLTRAFNDMTERLRSSQTELETANRTLRERNDALETLATTDSLTGLYNRKKLDAVLTDYFERFARLGEPFAVLMVALDNFGVITEDYGLAAGDEVLVKVGAILRQSVADTGTVARFVGDRFVAVVGKVPFDAAMDLAERVRSMIEAPQVRATGVAIVTTVSIGVAQSRDGDTAPDAIVFRADHALHAAKRAGGNRVQSSM